MNDKQKQEFRILICSRTEFSMLDNFDMLIALITALIDYNNSYMTDDTRFMIEQAIQKATNKTWDEVKAIYEGCM